MNAHTPINGHPAETDAERRARHLGILREMAELGMDVARDAAAKLRANEPGPPDPSLTFARSTHAVRQTIALETRVAAGTLERPDHRPDHRRPLRPASAGPDPRRAMLRQALYQAAAAAPDRAAFRREIDEAIENELRADPAGAIPVDQILAAICETIGLSIDPHRLSDELLGLTRATPARPTDPDPTVTEAPPTELPYHRRE